MKSSCGIRTICWALAALVALIGAGSAALAQEDVLPVNEPPVAQCMNVTILADYGNCCGWVTIDDINAGSFDPEGEIADICIVEVNGDDVGCQWDFELCGLGTHEVTLEITDTAGASARCTAFVTLENEPPNAACKFFWEHVNSSGYITVDVWDIDDGSADPEGRVDDMAIVAIDDSTFAPTFAVDVYGVGFHTVTLRITDDCGQTDECDASVEVQNIPPILDCRPYTYEYPDADGCVTVDMWDLIDYVSDPDGSDDIVDICIVQVDDDPIPCEGSAWVCGVGDHPVKIIVTDIAGAADTCIATATVLNRAPEAVCQNISFDTEYDCCFNVSVWDIDDGSSDPEGNVEELCIVMKDGEPVDCETEVEVCGRGDHYLWLRVTDHLGLSDSCMATVSIYGDPAYADCRSYEGYPNDDCRLHVHVDDLYDGSHYGLDSLVIVAVDSVLIDPATSVDVQGAGFHKVRIRVVDTCGDSDECEADVLVMNQRPEAYCRSISEDGGEDCCLLVDVWDIDDGSYDDDGNIDSLYISEVDGESMAVQSYEICGAGEHEVTLRITDRCGASDECQTTVTILNEPPVALCRRYEAEADDDCCIWVTTADIDDGSYDPDGSGDIKSMVITELDGEPVDSLDAVEVCDQGEHEVKLTVTDWCDATSSCVATVEVLNQPPVALCKYFEAEADENCCIMVAVADVDSGSYDPDGEGQIDDICIIAVDDVPVGCEYEVEICGAEHPHTVALEITDNCGMADTCEATVTVLDVTPPEITVGLDRYRLWPPNHKMVDIASTIEVWDNCDPDPEIILLSVTSSEPDDSLGDGSHEPDIQGADLGTADSTFSLRAERMGLNLGRIYNIVYTATDFSGNVGTSTVYVQVPHNQPGMAFAAYGFNEEGTGFTGETDEFVLVIPSRRAVYGMDQEGNTVLVEENFDARQLDVSRTRVGNTSGVLLPLQSWTLDQDGDGLLDLAVRYSVAQARPLVDEIVEARCGEVWVAEDLNPVGLHYVSPTGVSYLVYDIFNLGPPITLGSGGSSGLAGDETSKVTTLFPVQPNPFTSSTTMRFNLASDGRVSLSIYDARGTLVRSLEDRELPAGMHEIVWNGRDTGSKPVAPGVYFARFAAGSYKSTRKVMLLR